LKILLDFFTMFCCLLVFFLETVVLLLDASALNVLEDFDFSMVQILSGDGHDFAG